MQSVTALGGIIQKPPGKAEPAPNLGWLKFITKLDKRTFEIPKATMDVMQALDKECQVITVLQMSEETGQKMPSEVMAGSGEKCLVRAEKDVAVTGRFFGQVLLLELTTTKLTLGQAKHFLAGLTSISTRVALIPSPGDDLATTLATALPLLCALPGAFNLEPLKSYPEESELDLAAEHLSPNVLSLYFKSSKAEEQLDQCLVKSPDNSGSKVMVMYKTREVLTDLA